MSTPPREPLLVWRKPAPLWAIAALALALGPPALVLVGEGGMAQMTLIASALGLLAALSALAFAGALGTALRTRRDIVSFVVRFGLATALITPIAFQLLLHAMEGIEGASGPVGLPFFLPLALWPLAVMVGLPIALLGGLALAFVAFEPEREPEPPSLF
jgi:hypothetical protein